MSSKTSTSRHIGNITLLICLNQGVSKIGDVIGGKMEMSRQPHMQACERREEAMRKGSELILTLVASQND